MKDSPVVVVGLPIGAHLSAVDTTSILAKALRTAIPGRPIVQVPVVDGGDGTIDFIVTHTLGSFLEVEATDGENGQAIVPIGLAGPDNQMAVIEMGRVAKVALAGEPGTTFGIGELIQDALDEGAFSVLLGLSEPIARDAGLSIAQALGVRFLDTTGSEIDLRQAGADLSEIQRIDASGRDFKLLSSRFFVAKSNLAKRSISAEFAEVLKRIATIVKSDCGVDVSDSIEGCSESGVEFGLKAFLNAEVHPGFELVAQAASLHDSITSAREIVILGSFSEVHDAAYLQVLLADRKRCTILIPEAAPEEIVDRLSALYNNPQVQSLENAPAFVAPLRPGAAAIEVRRDVAIRLEKLLGRMFEASATVH